MFTAGRFGDDMPPRFPVRADNADVHRGAATLDVHLRLFGGPVGQDHHTRAECFGADELQLTRYGPLLILAQVLASSS